MRFITMAFTGISAIAIAATAAVGPIVIPAPAWAKAPTAEQLNREELARIQAQMAPYAVATAPGPAFPGSPPYPGPALGGQGGHGVGPSVMAPMSPTATSPGQAYVGSPPYPGPTLGGQGGHGVAASVMAPPYAVATDPSMAYPGPATGGHGGHGVQPPVLM
jgi:hypothetical protein